jgi:hypothetical protein
MAVCLYCTPLRGRISPEGQQLGIVVTASRGSTGSTVPISHIFSVAARFKVHSIYWLQSAAGVIISIASVVQGLAYHWLKRPAPARSRNRLASLSSVPWLPHNGRLLPHQTRLSPPPVPVPTLSSTRHSPMSARRSFTTRRLTKDITPIPKDARHPLSLRAFAALT